MSAFPTTAVASDQWLKRVSLIVSDSSGNGLDLSNLRIKFEIESLDVSHAIPPNGIITIYNLSDSTLKTLQEFTKVTLQAGYQPPGKFGIIFSGTIKQFMRGHESPTDSFIKIFASDSDLAWFMVTNKTLAPGYTAQDAVNTNIEAMKPAGVTMGYMPPLAGKTGGLLPPNARGRIFQGSSAALLDELGKSNNFTWHIANGKINIIPFSGYLPGVVVQLNAKSGLVGWPTNTNQGLFATCLLNPALRLAGLVQINNKDINTTFPAKGAGLPGTLGQNFPNASIGFPGLRDINAPATVTDDGFYRIITMKHVGDTRGNEWYSSLDLLAVDMSAPVGEQVPTVAQVAPETP
jgi:hypothetical protein